MTNLHKLNDDTVEFKKLTPLQKVNNAWTRAMYPIMGLCFLFVLLAMAYIFYTAQASDKTHTQAEAVNSSQVNALATALARQQAEAARGGTRVVTPPPSQIIQNPTVIPGATGAPGIQGSPGQIGPQGPQGPEGVPGKSPLCLLETSMCVGAKGDTGKDGTDGKDGTNGQDGTNGTDGKDGRGISSVKVVKQDDATCHLIITYTDDSSSDAGEVSCPISPPANPTPEPTAIIFGISWISTLKRR